MATNISNGDKYIGLTSCGLSVRKKAHLTKSNDKNNGCKKFYAAIRKYGKSAFVWDVVEVFQTRQEAIAGEIYYISKFQPEYNLSKGGEGTLGVASVNRRPVTCLTDGKMFKCLTDAAKHCGVTPATLVAVCQGKSRSAKGLHFVYGDTCYSKSEREEIIRRIENDSAARRKKVKTPKAYGSICSGNDATGKLASGPKSLSKPVICVTNNECFPSASEAARFYSVSRSAVVELCLGKNNRKSVSGLVFRYAGD
jgi:group I intron endonuclease